MAVLAAFDSLTTYNSARYGIPKTAEVGTAVGDHHRKHSNAREGVE